MRGLDLETECNPDLGPPCDYARQQCADRQKTKEVNAAMQDEEETRILKQRIEDGKQGAALLARYLALPQEWRQYASCMFENNTDIVRSLALIDAGRMQWEHVRLVRPFEEALTRAEIAVESMPKPQVPLPFGGGYMPC